jgi:hypothetical protein
MSNYYPTAFISLNDVIKQYALSTSAATSVSATTQAVIDSMDTVKRTQLKQLLFDVSDEIMAQWHRTFVPFIASYTILARSNAWRNGWSRCNGNLVFNLLRLPNADLLSLSSVVLNAETLSTSYYATSPEETYPAWQVTFDGDNVTLPSGTAFNTSLVLNGTWGYHENPSAMWASIGTLQANLSDSATTFVATQSTVANFEIYQYLQIESEILFVTDVVSAEPYTITVERGARGSTAAAHLSTVAIKAYRQMPAVIKAVRRRVVNLMQKMPELANLVQIGEGVAEASTESIDLKIDKRLIWGSP